MFETMPETRSHGPVLGRGSVSGAVLFHSLILLGLAGASLMARVEPGDPPPLPSEMQFVRIERPRLGIDLTAGEGGERKRPERKTPETQAKPRETRGWKQPDRIEDANDPARSDAAPPTGPENSATDGSGSEGTDGEGSGDGGGSGEGDGGVPWGDPDGREVGRPAGPAPDEVLEIGGDVEAPVLIRRVEPEYPSIARRAGIQGIVVLEGVIGSDGRIESLAVARSIPVLDRAALDAVRQWLYRPARQHGLLVRVRVTIRVDFRLD